VTDATDTDLVRAAQTGISPHSAPCSSGTGRS
jgi:hypothetical protein